MADLLKSCALALCLAAPAWADEAEDAFVEANVLGIFYHELGHAVIDIEGVPIFGQEEDAADVFSIFLIDAFFDEDGAQALAYDAALGFWGEAVMRDSEGGEVAYWSTHGPDEQRFYNTVCIFYGGNPDARDDFAEDMELPEDRAETCEEEYELAVDSWGAVLQAMSERQDGHLMDAAFKPESFAAEVLLAEIEAMNAEVRWDAPLTVIVEECGEANAFYAPSERLVIFCTEFETHLREMYRAF